MNLFPIEHRGGGWCYAAPRPGAGSAPGCNAIGGIRPEDLRLADAGISAVVKRGISRCRYGSGLCRRRGNIAGAPARTRRAGGGHAGVPRDRPAAACVRRCHRAPCHIGALRERGSDRMIQATRRAVLGTAAMLAMPGIVRAAGNTEISFYFPGSGRRTDYQNHRWLYCGFPAREPRHQGHADLCRHLPGHDDQGADRVEGNPGRRWRCCCRPTCFR